MTHITDLEAQIRILERSIDRERRARKNAEDVLRNKTFELLEANSRAAINADRLQHALLANKQHVWEWTQASGAFNIYLNEPGGAMQIFRRSTLDELKASIYKPHQEIFDSAFNVHAKGSSEPFTVVFQRFSKRSNQLRWIKLTGRGIEQNKDGHWSRMLGTYQDVTRETSQRASFEMVTRAFTYIAQPSFILSIENMHLEVNKAFCNIFGLKLGPKTQQEALSLLPSEYIIEQKKCGNYEFDVDIKHHNLVKTYTITLTPLITDNNSQGICIGLCSER